MSEKEKSSDDESDRPKKEGGEKKSKPPKPPSKKTLIIIGIVVAVLLLGVLLYWLHARNFESTDDAYTTAHVHDISARVARSADGRILLVGIGEAAFESIRRHGWDLDLQELAKDLRLHGRDPRCILHRVKPSFRMTPEEKEKAAYFGGFRFFRPFRALPSPKPYPGLTPWATFFSPLRGSQNRCESPATTYSIQAARSRFNCKLLN